MIVIAPMWTMLAMTTNENPRSSLPMGAPRQVRPVTPERVGGGLASPVAVVVSWDPGCVARGCPMSGTSSSAVETDVDVVVVGAGFAGLYMVYRLREMG